MRPTIPLDAWRIAVDLEATRAIQHQPGTPAHGCTCEPCRRWNDIAATVLPASLVDQLRRLGIAPERPTDLYVYHRDADGEHVRITFHVAGRLLSGPAVWSETDTIGAQLHYRALALPHQRIGLAVYPHPRMDASSPVLPAGCRSELIQIDIRMPVHGTLHR